jgi:hypothetical protein
MKLQGPELAARHAGIPVPLQGGCACVELAGRTHPLRPQSLRKGGGRRARRNPERGKAADGTHLKPGKPHGGLAGVAQPSSKFTGYAKGTCQRPQSVHHLVEGLVALDAAQHDLTDRGEVGAWKLPAPQHRLCAPLTSRQHPPGRLLCHLHEIDHLARLLPAARIHNSKSPAIINNRSASLRRRSKRGSGNHVEQLTWRPARVKYTPSIFVERNKTRNVCFGARSRPHQSSRLCCSGLWFFARNKK